MHFACVQSIRSYFCGRLSVSWCHFLQLFEFITLTWRSITPLRHSAYGTISLEHKFLVLLDSFQGGFEVALNLTTYPHFVSKYDPFLIWLLHSILTVQLSDSESWYDFSSKMSIKLCAKGRQTRTFHRKNSLETASSYLKHIPRSAPGCTISLKRLQAAYFWHRLGVNIACS